MSAQQNYYQEKYLKYKNKYLHLKMNAGANCANFGFNQHEGECWHDSLSMIFCYCDSIGDTIQEIFKSEESFREFIQNIDINELNGIPLEMLPPNYDLNNEEDKIKLLELSKEYIIELYDRYSNEQKFDLKPFVTKKINQLTVGDKDKIRKFIDEKQLLSSYPDKLKIFYSFLNNEPSYNDRHDAYEWFFNSMVYLLRETKLLYTQPSGLFRANSRDYSFKCVNYIFEISNHNSSHKLHFNETHGGRLNEYLITMSIISYFLLNYPITKIKQINSLQRALSVQEQPIQEQDNQRKLTRMLSLHSDPLQQEQLKPIEEKSLKFLSSNTFLLDNIFTKNNSVNNIINKLNNMKDCIKESSCILINSYSSLEGKDKIVNEENIFTLPQNHSQCFFICEKQLYFYDDNGIRIDGIKKLFVNFDWKTYLNVVIDNIIKRITDLNKTKIYKEFSQFYYDSMKHPITQLSMIKSFIIIQNKKYTKEIFKINLLDNLKIQLVNYDNPNIINYIKNNNIDIQTLSELLNISILSINYRAITQLINKENIHQCFTIQSATGYTPLHTLISNGNISLINSLLSHPKIYNCFNIQTDKGYTPLHIAIFFNEVTIIKALLQKSKIKNSFTIQDNNGHTPLSLAINSLEESKLQIVKELMNHYKIYNSFNIQDYNGNTPLHNAILNIQQNNNTINQQILDILIKHPNINNCLQIKNDNNLTPIELATQQNITLNIQPIQSEINKSNCEKLTEAISNNNYDLVEELLYKPKIEECLNIKNNQEETVLHTVITHGNIYILELLLSKKGIENAFIIKNKYEETPLYKAIDIGMIDMAKLLLNSEGIENLFTIQNEYGDTVLHLALSKNLEILKFLLSKPGIEQCFTIKNNYGNTPLHEAFSRTPLENREELLKHPKISIFYDIPKSA